MDKHSRLAVIILLIFVVAEIIYWSSIAFEWGSLFFYGHILKFTLRKDGTITSAKNPDSKETLFSEIIVC